MAQNKRHFFSISSRFLQLDPEGISCSLACFSWRFTMAVKTCFAIVQPRTKPLSPDRLAASYISVITCVIGPVQEGRIAESESLHKQADLLFNTESCNSHHLISSHLISSHLSLNREGRWGTTDDFTTSFLHFFPILHCPLGLGELLTCPFPDVVFPPLPLSALSCSTPPLHKKLALIKTCPQLSK